MALVETESLVLKTYDLAEADKIIVFLTREHGIVRGVARGVKRLKSRFGSGLEPLSVINLTYFQKDTVELVSIQQADLVSSNFFIAGDLDFLQKFSYLIELLITFFPPHDPNEKLYRMTRAVLETAASNTSSLGAMQLYFEIWLLRLAGYLPDWSTCERCGSAVIGDAYLASSLSVNCAQCGVTRGNQRLTATELNIVETARTLSPTQFFAAHKPHPEQISGLSSILRRVLSQSAGRELRGEVSLAVRR